VCGGVGLGLVRLGVGWCGGSRSVRRDEKEVVVVVVVVVVGGWCGRDDRDNYEIL
jgi:hypothetical protein